MTDPHVSLHRIPGAGAFDPFNLGAYVTCAAIALYSGSQIVPGAPLETPRLLGFAGLGVLLLLFLSRALLDAREAPLPARRLVVLAQLPFALLACWGLLQEPDHNDFAPALLVICAGQLPLVCAPRTVLLLLLAANAVLALTLLQAHSLLGSLLQLPAWCGFQVFAAVGCQFAVRLQQTGLTALRVSSELLATRHLLQEGARAEERLRLSRELHDIAGHRLTALKMQLLLHRHESGPRRSSPLEESLRLADELLADIRGVVSTLRAGEGVDLPEALRALDPGLPRPRVVYDIESGLRIADMRSADALLRCAQEALTNALRHSGAQTVRLRLGYDPAGVVLSVEDDGRGWRAGTPEGYGIQGMRERLAEVGGQLELARAAAGGLLLRAVLPGLAPPAGLSSHEPEVPLFEPSSFCVMRRLSHADDRAGG